MILQSRTRLEKSCKKSSMEKAEKVGAFAVEIPRYCQITIKNRKEENLH